MEKMTNLVPCNQLGTAAGAMTCLCAQPREHRWGCEPILAPVSTWIWHKAVPDSAGGTQTWAQTRAIEVFSAIIRPTSNIIDLQPTPHHNLATAVNLHPLNHAQDFTCIAPIVAGSAYAAELEEGPLLGAGGICARTRASS